LSSPMAPLTLILAAPIPSSPPISIK
jgi:hypothetical protein